MSAGEILEYPRFKWLVPGRIAGAPHPDLSGGLVAMAPFLRAQGIGAIVTLLGRSMGTFRFVEAMQEKINDFDPLIRRGVEG